ncbi:MULTISPECIES: hypothetical protein [Streptomyces]|uniref:Uncharacterized protein n=1 Tax=Streptomyces dengpaensis TaxID=2049881 RepID=A0ABN5I0L6_9ACTN|nr:hypothetical protein C4B68_06060 [Streptomyces dengpaensis]PIB11685.1 hypothetical protein B1C81_00040 [Streptomyces sp. HG99]
MGSAQGTRRGLAGLDDLLPVAPADPREPLVRHGEPLTRAVERTVPAVAYRAFALRPDRQGIEQPDHR